MSSGLRGDLGIALALGVVAVVLSIWAVPGLSGWLGAGLALLMLPIAVIDVRHLIIPDELSAAALALALIHAATDADTSPLPAIGAALLRGLIVMALFWALRLGYRRLRQREGLGLGDVKLAFVAGAWLEAMMIPVAIEIAALTALTGYLVTHFVGKKPVDARARLPFGLFFAPSIWLAWLLGAAVV